jgi:hypothetical protein
LIAKLKKGGFKMSRLIDADLWIEELSNSFVTINYHPDLGDAFQCMEAEKHNENVYDLITIITERPTVYVGKAIMPKKVYHFLYDDTFETTCCGTDITNKDYKYCPECGCLLGDVEDVLE